MSSLIPLPNQAESSSSTDLVPAMSHLFTAMGDSDVALREELAKTSQVISAFIDQTNERDRINLQRIIELEGREISHQAEREETKQMHQAQMRALEQLTETVMSMNQRLGALESRVSSITATEQIMQNKLDTHKHNLTLYGCTNYSEHRGLLYTTNFPGSTPLTYTTTLPK